MKWFKKEELKAVLIILVVVIGVSLQNFKVAIRRGRDADRKIALGEVHTALNYYQNDFGFFPPASPDGKIVACAKEGVDYENLSESSEKQTTQERLLELFAPCEWGKDSLSDISDQSYPSYIEVLPNDPEKDSGVTFFYASNLKNFQLLGSLESASEDEYEESIAERNILCGSRVCNFGKSNGAVPLDKSLQEYENGRQRVNEQN